MNNFQRMLKPSSVAVIGGGAWCENVVEQCLKMGFTGDIWPVHPTRSDIRGRSCFASVGDLPAAPDACFVGVNRFATIDVVKALHAKGAAGAVCFASGFSESVAEDANSVDLQIQLVDAAQDMIVLGPNCYGFINYLDRALLWPDQHGGQQVDKGVAILTQSSNVAINITMQRRGLPIGYICTVGNQAQTGMSQLGTELLADPRITALGMHIEGIDDVRAFEALAIQAAEFGKPVIALKVGASHQAQEATISHTASLAGSDAGARALFARMGIGQVDNLSEFLEALKLAHVAGKLPNTDALSMSCSGGEASLMADIGQSVGVDFPPLSQQQIDALRSALGPMVKLANPLDYHTYIWGDANAMTQTFQAAMNGHSGANLLVLDIPRPDRCDAQSWTEVIPCFVQAAKTTNTVAGVVASLADTMPEDIATNLMAQNIVAFGGMETALKAIKACSAKVSNFDGNILVPLAPKNPQTLSERKAKSMLKDAGLHVPRSEQATNVADAIRAAEMIGYPTVLKGEGVAHKTEAGAVVLNLVSAKDVGDAATKMPSDSFLVEEMVQNGLVELLIGVVLDPAHGYVLTLAAGGQLTELLNDKATVLIPAHQDQVIKSLKSLKIWKMMHGYRGAKPINLDAVLNAIKTVQNVIIENHGRISELEINPLICTTTDAIAADALIKLGELDDG